jgi:hypothetical protein
MDIVNVTHPRRANADTVYPKTHHEWHELTNYTNKFGFYSSHS